LSLWAAKGLSFDLFSPPSERNPVTDKKVNTGNKSLLFSSKTLKNPQYSYCEMYVCNIGSHSSNM